MTSIRLEPPVAIYPDHRAQQQLPLLRLPPVPDAHPRRSQEAIRQAASAVRPGRAIVLGAGACREIPLGELLQRFGEVTLVDADESALRQGLAAHDPAARFRNRCQLRGTDLTGVLAVFREQMEQILGRCSSAAAASAALVALIRQLEPHCDPLNPPYDLVVCSTLLSQLHVQLSTTAIEAFARRFPKTATSLSRSEAWQRALYDFARRVEKHLIDQLAALVDRNGRIYLSATVRVTFVRLESKETWVTHGAWRMTRTGRLADDLDHRFRILSEVRWPWVETAPREIGRVGKLFDVQALILARQKG